MNRRDSLKTLSALFISSFTADMLLAKDSTKSTHENNTKSPSDELPKLSGVAPAPSAYQAKMNIAIIGASGKVGALITQECLDSGFSVSAFVRNAKKLKLRSARLNVIQKDIFSLNAQDLKGFDAIVDAFGVVDDVSLYGKHIRHLAQILVGNPARLIVVGGAGSLYMDSTHTTQLLDTKDFPKEYLQVARAHAEVLAFLRTNKALNWVYVSPPAEFEYKGKKSANYKIIGEEFETNSRGESKGSYADYALAIVEIIKNPSINKKRVGVIGL